MQDLLTHSHTLARTLVDERLNHLPPGQALPAALAVIAAGDDQRWTRRTTDIARRLHLPADVALTDLLGHITTWDRDRPKAAATQIAAGQDTRARLTGLTTLRAEERWAPFARQINRALITGYGWPMLSDTLDQADRHGIDVYTVLPALANTQPLDRTAPATDLAYRLIAKTNMPIEAPITRRPSQQRIPPIPTAGHAQRPTRQPNTSLGR